MPISQKDFNARFKEFCRSKNLLKIIIPGAGLKSKYETVLIKHYIEEKTHAEIAEELHMTRESVGNLICKAKKELKLALDNISEFSDDEEFKKIIYHLLDGD